MSSIDDYRCYLCGKSAGVLVEEEFIHVLYHRLYNLEKRKWGSEVVCPACQHKMNGTGQFPSVRTDREVLP